MSKLETKRNNQIILHPLGGSSLRNWLNLLIENGGIDKQYTLKAFYIFCLSCIGIPLRILEKLKFDRKIEACQIDYPPIFIIGHWRSGTTYLHNLIIQDSQMGYISNAQVFAPECYFVGKPVVSFFLNKFMPHKRPMDNVLLSENSPQEEEFAMGNISLCSFYHGWYFPKNIKKYYRNFVLFQENRESTVAQWKKLYLPIIKKATLYSHGKRLVIKNPLHTARIKILLEIFPNAKFIHIYRNPYAVYNSSKKLYKKMVAQFVLQDICEQEIDNNIIEIYQLMMQDFFKNKSIIPSENFVEIKYENLIGNELSTLKLIYEKLNISGFEQAESSFIEYLKSHESYQKNKYEMNQEAQEKIAKHWKFAIEEWQYDVPSTSSQEKNNIVL
jgi:hypothetical protein